MELTNLIDILKYAPKGYKLYSPLYGNVIYESNTNESIKCIVKSKNNQNLVKFFDKYGRIDSDYYDCECMLYPSKDNYDWTKFLIIPKHSIVLCSNDGINWELKKYLNKDLCYSDNPWVYKMYKYIVKLENFNFENFKMNVNNANIISE